MDMKAFMADIDLPLIQDQNFMDKIPDQRLIVDQLMSDGKISNYAVSMDRNKLWVLVEANDVNEAELIIQCFAIIDDIEYSINELLFNQRAILDIPNFSLN